MVVAGTISARNRKNFVQNIQSNGLQSAAIKLEPFSGAAFGQATIVKGGFGHAVVRYNS